jgi:hemoglobin-like flavoprotein
MEGHVEEFRRSLKRCLANPDFLRQFYHSLLAASDEVRAKFEHTDFERQTQVLADSLYLIAVAAQGEGSGPAWQEMSRLAHFHSRDQLNVRPGLYDLWLHCLVTAAREHDPEFTPELEEAWRKTLRVGIDYLRDHYEASQQES